jgi:hypothetical protein
VNHTPTRRGKPRRFPRSLPRVPTQARTVEGRRAVYLLRSEARRFAPRYLPAHAGRAEAGELPGRGRSHRAQRPTVQAERGEAVTPEAWTLVARELNTVRQLARNWLTQEQAAKIARHLNEARRILRGGPSTKAKGRDPREREALRLRVFEAYGGACACCGESHPRALTVDHVRPLKGRRRPKDVYKLIIREGFPASYQVLCLNCNQLKGAGEACPHRRKDAA